MDNTTQKTECTLEDSKTESLVHENSNSHSQGILEYVRYVWQLLFRPGQAVEMRAMHVPRRGTVSGYYDNPDELTQDALQINGLANIYVTLNPVDTRLLARSHNRATPFVRTTTSDKDILKRAWLFIDFDSVRPAGVSATDEEKSLAYNRTLECQAWLYARFSITSVVADSGNGGHLLIKVDEPNDDETRSLFESVLKALSDVWSDDKVTVDETTFNAARICKLYGFMSCKGDNFVSPDGDTSKDRPHRQCVLTHIPQNLAVTQRNQLEQIRLMMPETPQARIKSALRADPFDMEGWMQKHGVEYTNKHSYNRGYRWQLEHCPFDESHQGRDVALFTSEDGRPGFRCLHNSCKDHDWSAAKRQIEGSAACEPDITLNADSVDISGIAELCGLTKQNKADGIDSSPVEDLTDSGNALRFSAAQQGNLIHDGNGFFRYNQQGLWLPDRGAVKEDIITYTSVMYQEAMQDIDPARRKNSLKHWHRTRSASGINAIHSLLPHVPGIRVVPEQFDQLQDRISCANGTIDLTTGKLREHQRSEYWTKQLPFAFEPDAKCPVFLGFLNKVMPNRETRRYLQKAVGYTLMGVIREHAIFFFYGDGSNGKSTLFIVLQSLFGPWWFKAPIGLLMAGGTPANEENASPSLVKFQNARLITFDEVRSNDRLNEAQCKNLSGGDPITARALYKSPVTFDPTWLLWLFGNHKPRVTDPTNSIWRRLKLFPMLQQISPAEIDTDLPNKLKAELPGILNWALEGCLAWQAEGLGSCSEIDEATKEYRSEEDVLGLFLEECCALETDATDSAKNLYAAFSFWAKRRGERGWTQALFGRRLKERRFESRGSNKGVVYLGLRVLPEVLLGMQIPSMGQSGD